MLIQDTPTPGEVTVGARLRQLVWKHHSLLEATKARGANAVRTFADWAAFLYSAKVACTATHTPPGSLASPGAYSGASAAVEATYRALGEVHLYNDVVGNTSNSKCTTLVAFYEFFRADSITKGSLPAPTQGAIAKAQAVSSTVDHDCTSTVNLNGGSAVSITSVTKTAGAGTFSIVNGLVRYVAPGAPESATATVVHTNAEGQTCSATLTVTVS